MTLKVIWEFIKKYYSLIFFGIIIVLVVLLFSTCNRLTAEKKAHAFDNQLNAQNRTAMLDSVTRTWNKKAGVWESEKAAYVLNFADLENYNKGLYDTIKKLKGKIAFLISTQGKIDLGGITIGNNLVTLKEPNHFGLDWKSVYTDPGLTQTLKGQSRFYAIPNKTTMKWDIKADSTLIDTNLMNIKVMYGFRELKNQYQVFAVSASPKIVFTDLTGGYFIDKPLPQPPVSPKRWAIGPYIGFGLNTDYNLANPRFGWSAGFSIHYDIIQWRFGKK